MTILPIYNIIALPDSKLWLQNNIYTDFAKKAPVEGERVTLLAQKEEKPRDQLTAENFQPIGVVGTISTVNSSGFTCIEMQNRVNIDDIVQLPDKSFSLTISRRPDVDDLDQEDAKRRLAEVKERIIEFSKGQEWEGMMRNFAATWNNLWVIGTSLSPWLGLSEEERYALLAEDSLQKRFDELERLLMESLER